MSIRNEKYGIWKQKLVKSFFVMCLFFFSCFFLYVNFLRKVLILASFRVLSFYLSIFSIISFTIHFLIIPFFLSSSIMSSFFCIISIALLSFFSVRVVFSVFKLFCSSFVFIRLSFLPFFISVMFINMSVLTKLSFCQLSVIVFTKIDLWWGFYSLSFSEFKVFILSRRFKKLSLFLSTLVSGIICLFACIFFKPVQVWL